jgi:type IV secretory pathway ATPase VirB11/archaellum biosynthesis ATPase
VRYSHEELTPLSPLFEDIGHLQRIIARLLADAGTELREDQPYLEVGLNVGERAVCVSVFAPPLTAQLTADIRVHPKVLPSLDDLVSQQFMNAKAAEILRALVASPHGFMIVGDTESGKTTLLSILAQLLPTPESIIAVERAGELRLPLGARRLAAQWAVGEQIGVSFGAQISTALEQKPACILLDEVRSDEPTTIAPLLTTSEALRQIWSMRGTIETKRLHSALGMLARRADMSQSEAMVIALYQRLPFVVTVRRREGKLQLYSIGEWQFKHDAEYPTLTLLAERRSNELVVTGEQPMHALVLSPDFWI